MTDIRDRDDSVDRLLRQTLRAPDGAGATESCLDAETVAAWMDGALSGAALAAAEAHAATCPRCQAIVATMVRIEPAEALGAVAPHAVPQPPRTRPWLPWLIPVAAAAVIVIAVFIERTPRTPAVTQMAREEAAPPTAPATVPAPATLGQVEGRASTRPGLGQQSGQAIADRKDALSKAQDTVAPKPKEEGRAAARPASPAPINAPAQVTPPPPPLPAAAGARAAAAAVPPAQPAQQPPVGATGTATGLSVAINGNPLSTINAAPVTNAARLAEPAVAPTIVAEFASLDLPPPGVVGGVAGAGAGGGGGGGARGGGGGRGGRGGGGAAGGGASRAALAQDAATPLRWRIFSSGVVERSANSGTSWEPVTMDPPETRVTRGVAPAPRVCWLVGREGVVLLSTDGLRFVPVKFPEPVDLSSIRAVNAREAAVTTVDGRVFVTTDGGLTWRAGGQTGVRPPRVVKILILTRPGGLTPV